MKKKSNVLFSLAILLAAIIHFAVQAQQKNGATARTKDILVAEPPKGIVRTVKQDKKGNIWITSWEGVFKYEGKSFTNVTRNASSARFFSVLEDRKGNFWFGSVGSGVYRYDGKSVQNFTTNEGLANDQVCAIYEDKAGTIWFGTANGISRYDPSASLGAGSKSFQNLKLSEVAAVTATDSVYHGADAGRPQADSVQVSANQRPIPEAHWMHNDVNAIIEDNSGKYWFGTRGYAKVYDGKNFTTVTNAAGKPFTNVRSIIKDKKGNIWLGGFDGLWRYDGKSLTNFSQKFVGYIYEDKKGNIWTSSERDGKPGWALSRYDAMTLTDKKPTVTEITDKPMLFGILEDNKGNIWFGAIDGVYRYDGKTVTGFKSAAGKK